MTFDKTEKDKVLSHYREIGRLGHHDWLIGYGGLMTVMGRNVLDPHLSTYPTTIAQIAEAMTFLEYGTPSDIPYPMLRLREEYR